MRKYPIWHFRKSNVDITGKLQKDLGLSPVLAQVLYQRGIRASHEARKFLWGETGDLEDPCLIPGMEQAVNRLEEARRRGQRVLIYGVYDVDGICSVILLKEFLDYLGIENDYYIPSRFTEGYGLNREAVILASAQNYELLVTVDCGVSSVEEVTLAGDMGLEVVITDHHQPPEQLPPALAVVNPKLVPGEVSYRDLAGAGVVYKLVAALVSRLQVDYDLSGMMDLVALATVADIVPLLGENRILVKAGLKSLECTSRPGLRALLEETGLNGKQLSTWHIGFVLAPRLNAAGRMGEAAAAVQLLMTRDKEEAAGLARFLDQQNRRRQEIEAEILEQARQEVAATIDTDRDKVILVGREGWHQGVVGIVASRIAEAFQRPAILVSWENDRGRGSGRSIAGFDLYQALNRCQHLLLKFGGHRQAAGLTLEKSQFAQFKEELNRVAEEILAGEEMRPQIDVDAEVSIEAIDVALLKELELLEPYGEGNPVPNLVLRRAQVVNPGVVGKNAEHLKFWIEGEGKRLESIAFGMGEFIQLSYSTSLFDVVFQPVLDTYNGESKLVLKVKDIKPSRLPDDPRSGAQGLVFMYPRGLVSMEEDIKSELQGSHPVLLVYPTMRCMERHLLSVKNSFPRRILTPLNGGLSPTQQARAARELAWGKPRLFLTTNAFLKYYIKNFSLPGNLRTVHFLWPEEPVPDLSRAGTGNNIRVVRHAPVSSPLVESKLLDDWDGLKGAFIYTNRDRTVRNLCQRWEKPALEAGVTDLTQRRQARHRFLRGESEVLISDARFGANFPLVDRLDKLVFADSPYGLYEAHALTSQIGKGEVEVLLGFSGTDLEFNQHYLEKNFPDIETIRAFLQYLGRRVGRACLTLDRALKDDLVEFVGRKVEDAELGAVLRILVELHLCQVRRQGATMQLFFTGAKTGRVNVQDSPYFLEGMAEKESFRRWREACKIG
ncbi:MAG: single-stranded-DNA-specific exonuclease RecJ [Syntrophomonadaceae bacterium]|nr:single-stranded-DNA-specific exonuclease RecJ [Syntrophomonadaceae bacterium]